MINSLGLSKGVHPQVLLANDQPPRAVSQMITFHILKDLRVLAGREPEADNCLVLANDQEPTANSSLRVDP
jgi:hypothetical protein